MSISKVSRFKNLSSTMPSINLIMLGIAGVGKSTLLRVITEPTSDKKPSFRELIAKEKPPVTIGVDYMHIYFTNSLNSEFEIRIWDTSGQERFNALTPSYMRRSNVAILVFALNSINSFNSLSNIISTFKMNQSSPDKTFFLFGNKSDIEPRTVDQSLIDDFKKTHEIVHYFEVSALNGQVPVETFMEDLITFYEKSNLCKNVHMLTSFQNPYNSFITPENPPHSNQRGGNNGQCQC